MAATFKAPIHDSLRPADAVLLGLDDLDVFILCEIGGERYRGIKNAREKLRMLKGSKL